MPVMFKRTKYWLNAIVTESHILRDQRNDAADTKMFITWREYCRCQSVCRQSLVHRQMTQLPSCLSRATQSKSKNIIESYIEE
jgi:hypothetical protein